ncbi:MAG TPA: hypothetical protein VH370_17885 [Humisphaera sp.]|jgi:hypothetical protein|nr:hypothetical protein [Humisphaera sp.]
MKRKSRNTRRLNSSRFDDQPLEQMDAEYRAVDREFSLAETKPLSAADRRQWRRALSRQSERQRH